MTFPMPLVAALFAGFSSTADMDGIVDEEYQLRYCFQMTGTVVSVTRAGCFVLADGNGRSFFSSSGPSPRVGDRIRLGGHTDVTTRGSPILTADDITVMGRESVPPAVDVLAADLDRRHLRFSKVRMRGIVTSNTPFSQNPDWQQLVLRTGPDLTYAFVFTGQDVEDLEKFNDAEVSITGICLPPNAGPLAFQSSCIELEDERSIEYITAESTDPFDAPYLGDSTSNCNRAPGNLSKCRIVGLVLATWQSTRLLLRSADGRIVGLNVDGKSDLPQCGEWIETVGFPETSSRRINLTDAVWRLTMARPSPAADEQFPIAVQLGKNSNPGIWQATHGQLVRLNGTVRDLSTTAEGISYLTLDSNNTLVPIDISSCPCPSGRLDCGTAVQIDGVCVLNDPSERFALSSYDNGFFIVIRRPSDITVLERPPWWTPGRLLTVIGSLLTALIGILIWNASLRRLAERRGRELFRAEIGKAGAELRIGERTRLAVELHDSIAQNLTAISFQVASAMSSKDVAPDASARHLENADRMLRSCRTELRRCLWDLRSDTLEEPDFAKAIRTTVSEVLDEATAHIRFNVPRAHVSDTTTHAILNIIRELTANAVRHGNARNVWIAGETDRRQLRFSVRDDGCGFDVSAAPGEDSGHFGLKGIHERLNPLDGSLQLTSDSRGTRAFVKLHLQRLEDETNGQDQDSHS